MGSYPRRPTPAPKSMASWKARVRASRAALAAEMVTTMNYIYLIAVINGKVYKKDKIYDGELVTKAYNDIREEMKFQEDSGERSLHKLRSD